MKIVKFKNIVWENPNETLPIEWEIEPKTSTNNFEEISNELSMSFQILEDFEQEVKNNILSFDIEFVFN